MGELNILGHTLLAGESLFITNTGSHLLLQQAHQSTTMPIPDKLFDDFLQMRWVVTYDLDGKQLQFRHKRSHIYPPEWTEWMPVPTTFMSHKLEEPDAKTP